MISNSISDIIIQNFSDNFDLNASDCDSETNYPVVLLEVDVMESD